MSTHTDAGPISTAITKSIRDNLQPIHLEVINESYMHNVPKGSETHFKVLVVCIVVLPSLTNWYIRMNNAVIPLTFPVP